MLPVGSNLKSRMEQAKEVTKCIVQAAGRKLSGSTAVVSKKAEILAGAAEADASGEAARVAGEEDVTVPVKARCKGPAGRRRQQQQIRRQKERQPRPKQDKSSYR